MEFEPTKDDLQQLREWIQKMPHINPNYDDQFLAAFVRAAKGSLQRAKIVIENFSALGMRYPEFFGTLDPLHPRLQETLSVFHMFPLPQKTTDGSIVFFCCSNSKFDDPSKSHVHEYYRYLLLTIYVLIWENNFGSGKIKFVSDVKGITLAHYKEATPTFAKQIIAMFQATFPVRLKSSSIYSVPSIMEQLFNLFKVFAKKKISDRMNVYSGIDKLIEDIPREMLPIEYGGFEESVFLIHDKWKKKIESYRQRFLEEEQLLKKLDSLRPQREEDKMVGTFRQLKVD